MHTTWDKKQSWGDNKNCFFFFRIAVLWKPRCKLLTLLRAQYSSFVSRYGCIHDGRCNFSGLSGTVLSPTAEAECSVTTDIWKTVFRNKALPQRNIRQRQRGQKIAVSFVPVSGVEGYVIFNPDRGVVFCAALRIHWLMYVGEWCASPLHVGIYSSYSLTPLRCNHCLASLDTLTRFGWFI